MNRIRRVTAGVAIAAFTAAGTVLGGAASAAADPAIDPVQALYAAGVPPEIAELATHAVPVAAGVDTVNLIHPTGGFPGSKIDAVVDHPGRTVTIVQRWLEYEPSELQVAWVNLGTGRAAVTGLLNAVPGTLDGLYPTIDRTAVLPTGPGPVLLIVYGRVPGWTGLIPLAPEYFGYLTPTPALVQV